MTEEEVRARLTNILEDNEVRIECSGPKQLVLWALVNTPLTACPTYWPTA